MLRGGEQPGRSGDLGDPAAAEHRGLLAVPDEAVGLSDGGRARRAGGRDAQAAAVRVIADGEVACGDVRDHLGDEQRGNAARPAVQQVRMLLAEGVKAADAGAEDDAELVLIHAAR